MITVKKKKKWTEATWDDSEESKMEEEGSRGRSTRLGTEDPSVKSSAQPKARWVFLSLSSTYALLGINANLLPKS